MNRFENAAQRLLKPVFNSGKTAMTMADQAELATWAVKSLVSYAYAAAPRDVDAFPKSEIEPWLLTRPTPLHAGKCGWGGAQTA
jgi:hypothetical protein